MANLLPIAVTQYRVKRIAFDGLDENLLRARFKDGRISGLLIEDLLAYVYRNVTRSGDEGTPYDIFLSVDGRPLRYQCKTANWKKPSSAFDLKPSYMKGKGRRYDRQQMEEHFRLIDGFALVDLSGMPDLTIWTLPVSSLLDTIGEKSCSVKIAECDNRVAVAPTRHLAPPHDSTWLSAQAS
jgi:hypothetical protein